MVSLKKFLAGMAVCFCAAVLAVSFSHIAFAAKAYDQPDVHAESEEEEDSVYEAEETDDFVAVAYTEPDFRGSCWFIEKPGQYDLGSGFNLPNDSIRSIRVMPGYTVKFFEHSQFEGDEAEYDEDTSDLGKKWSRQASSLIVEGKQGGKTDADAWKEMVFAAEGPGYEELDISGAELSKALKKHSKAITKFKDALEFNWYGETTDEERVETGGELLKIFGGLGVKVSGWKPNTFAQMMNNFYDWRKDKTVWEMACMVLNLNPETFEQ